MFDRFIMGGEGEKKGDYFILKGSSKDKKFMLAKFPELCTKPLGSRRQQTLPAQRPEDATMGCGIRARCSCLRVKPEELLSGGFKG